MSRRYVGVPAVAARYSVSAATIYGWAAAGWLPYRKLAGRKALLFDESELDLVDDTGCPLERRKLRGGGVVVRPKAAS